MSSKLNALRVYSQAGGSKCKITILTKVSRFHPLGTVDISTTFHNTLDTSVWNKNGAPSDIAISREIPLAWLKRGYTTRTCIYPALH